MSFAVYDPRGTRERAEAVPAASAPKGLAGLTLGLLDNTKEQADVLLNRAAELLAKEGVKLVFARKPSFSRVMPPEVFEQLKMCDIVITGLGG
jgi:hypothetical protein